MNLERRGVLILVASAPGGGNLGSITKFSAFLCLTRWL